MNYLHLKYVILSFYLCIYIIIELNILIILLITKIFKNNFLISMCIYAYEYYI